MAALLAITMIEAGEAIGPAHVVLAATIPLVIACNAWVFPLQSFLVGAYLLYRVWARKRIDWRNLLAGGAIASILIYPFLIRFAPQADALHNALRFVPWNLHTPPVAGLLVFYPLFAILALNVFFGERRELSSAFCMIWIVLIVVSECIWVDDLYSGKFERFNTALKWWAWIYSGAILTVGGINLRSASRICRWGTWVVLALICGYSVDLFANLVGVPKPHLGQLDGAAWIREDPAQRAILEFLKTQPDSIVLERMPERAYFPPPALVMFSGQAAFLGWANHEDTWRGYRADIDQRMNEIGRFYNGDLPGAARWLEQNHVKYVLWLKDENETPAGTFEKIDEQIRGRYRWSDYSAQAGLRVGVWSLVDR